MKTILASLVVLATTSSAFADEIVVTAPPAKTLGVDAMAVVPVGNYGNVATVGIGALGRLEVPAGSGFVTGRAGVIFHAMNADVDASLTLVPIYAGYRLPLGAGGGYLAGELGVTLAYGEVETQFGTMSASETEIGATLMAGMRRGALDLRAGLFSPDVDAVGFLASAGYDFAAF
jgi:hypothetical protein